MHPSPAPATRLANGDAGRKRRMEIYAFLIVTAVLMPVLAVATVGTWGLVVWTYQMVHGPPGPPSPPPK
jgi:periplasmic nitrate reductase NapE